MNDDTANRMTDIGDRVAERIPEGCGYLVMVFPNPGHTGMCQFVSNDRNRARGLDVMKSFILQNADQDPNPTPIIDERARKIAKALKQVSFCWQFDESPLGPVGTYDVRYLCDAVLRGKDE